MKPELQKVGVWQGELMNIKKDDQRLDPHSTFGIHKKE